MFRVISLIGIIGTLAAIVVHYVAFGPHHADLPEEERTVPRLSVLERLVHATTVLSFLVLAGSGFRAALGAGGHLTGWLRVIHITAAPVFVFGLTLVSLIWAEDCRLRDYDWEWAKRFGGYLGYKGHVPAGRFNGGQKSFLWFVLVVGLAVILSGVGRAWPLFGEDVQLLLYQVHRYGSLCLLLGILAHIYLGTVANPGTFRVILNGRVTPAWARNHHPNWWERIKPKAKAEASDAA